MTATKTTHTPGPWYIICSKIGMTIEGRGTDCRIAEMCSTEGTGFAARVSRGESNANARLIAAAPDLLWACQHGNEADISAAIAKATPSSQTPNIDGP